MDRLQAIFKKQKELMTVLHPLPEGITDFKVDIHSREGQRELRELAWWVVEEMGEALMEERETPKLHEELIDVLHFLTELSIMAGYDYNTIMEFEPTYAEGDYLEMFYQEGREASGRTLLSNLPSFIVNITMACHCLKNKPWKKTITPTDTKEFGKYLESTWTSFFSIMHAAQLTPHDIAEAYLNKHKTNLVRQESGY